MQQALIFLTIVFIHWVLDFVCQTDWQATNKSTNNWALFDHVITYFCGWVFACIVYCYCMNNWTMILFAPITFICHFITDYFTSRLNTKLYNAGKIHNFFVSIGFDQFLHYVQLFLTYKILNGI